MDAGLMDAGLMDASLMDARFMNVSLMDATSLSSQLEFDCKLVVLDSTTSTNDAILSLAQKDRQSLTAPLFVISSIQTSGRGRLGRAWASPEGGVYLSALLKLNTAEKDSGAHASLSPLAALAVRDALQPFQSNEVQLKWPNDVLSSQGKLAGILIELRQINKTPFAVVGIGINVRRPDAGAFEAAAYLDDDCAREPLPGEVAVAVINGLLRRYYAWQAEACDFSSFVAAYEEHMAQIGQHVCVRNALGSEIANGVVKGIDEQGRLLLSGASGIEAIVAGELTLRKP